MNISGLFNSFRFSDLLVKFSGREIKAHRFVLCELQYFDKLLGPESPFAEAKEAEVTLLDDDPDAVEALIRHLYKLRLELPQSVDAVRFYCEVVVTADKYGVPMLSEEAARLLRAYMFSLDSPNDFLFSLETVSKEYSDYAVLKSVASGQLDHRLEDVASLPELPALVISQPYLFDAIVRDAVKYRSLRMVVRYRCSKCLRFSLGKVPGNIKVPKCCQMPAIEMGIGYLGKNTL